MSTCQLPSSLLDCKPPPNVVDTPAAAAVYADSAAAAGTGNGRSASCPDDVREMHKYYWDQQRHRATVPADSAPPTGPDDVVLQRQQVAAADQLPPELRHDDYSSAATGSARVPPPKLMPYGLPVCGGGDAAAAKLLTNAAPPSEYYHPPAAGGYMTHNDYVAYGYGPGPPGHQDLTSMMVANTGGGYHHLQPPVGYPCQRMTPASSPAAAAHFADVKVGGGLLPHGNTSADLYQWVRKQQNFTAAANAIGIAALLHRRIINLCNFTF